MLLNFPLASYVGGSKLASETQNQSIFNVKNLQFKNKAALTFDLLGLKI